MIWTSVGAAALAALCFYLASPHQHVVAAARAMPRGLRCLALALCAGAVLAAVPAQGWGRAFFIAATSLMLGLVALPFLDLWQRSRHVG